MQIRLILIFICFPEFTMPASFDRPAPTSPRLRLVSAAISLVLGSAAMPSFAAEAPATDLADASARATPIPQVDVKAQRVEASSPKYTAPLLDTPQTITVVTRQTIDEQNLLSLRDILSTLPGITFGAGEGGGGYGDSINLRGFTASNDITVDGVRDSAQYSRTDPFNLEQLELVNGANSVYAGAGAIGGSINLVSKTPKLKDQTRVSLGLGTDNYVRTTVDANAVIGDGIAARLNLMTHDADIAGRDVANVSRWGFAPSIGFRLNGDLQFVLGHYHMATDDMPDAGGFPYGSTGSITGSATGAPLVPDRNS